MVEVARSARAKPAPTVGGARAKRHKAQRLTRHHVILPAKEVTSERTGGRSRYPRLRRRLDAARNRPLRQRRKENSAHERSNSGDGGRAVHGWRHGPSAGTHADDLGLCFRTRRLRQDCLSALREGVRMQARGRDRQQRRASGEDGGQQSRARHRHGGDVDGGRPIRRPPGSGGQGRYVEAEQFRQAL